MPRGFYDKVKGHTGCDWIMPEGTSLSLPTVNTVTQIRTQAQMGNTLYLTDKDGNILVFSHLVNIPVSKGDRVGAGKVFAFSGNTGSATTNPHVHMEILSQTPEEGAEMMTRRLGEFSGYNIDPIKYLDSLTEETEEHWSDEAMAWMLEHEIITEEKDPDEFITWGEYAVTSKRLAERILDWTNNK